MSDPTPLPAGFQRIVLTGFMGSGKSTVGRLLADRLTWSFADLDREVEATVGRSVPQIFASEGEAQFRELEANCLTHLLRRDCLVLALGGGAPESARTFALLRTAASTFTVYLAAPFPVLLARCGEQSLDPDAVPRPLLRDGALARLRFDRRQSLYTALAHRTLATEALTPKQLVNAILQGLPAVQDTAP